MFSSRRLCCYTFNTTAASARTSAKIFWENHLAQEQFLKAKKIWVQGTLSCLENDIKKISQEGHMSLHFTLTAKEHDPRIVEAGLPELLSVLKGNGYTVGYPTSSSLLVNWSGEHGVDHVCDKSWTSTLWHSSNTSRKSRKMRRESVSENTAKAGFEKRRGRHRMVHSDNTELTTKGDTKRSSWFWKKIAE
eukprot:TRINITY_DN94947_c0_g1_i1.p1 TRINITY_DN94947_c0_g1~~TRINITY_DN94947_c0_g1_i1.p1  ORF type:complete len:191 (-),score=7.76 TRINITY_DN94947_c0_g1_i1:167-739(-)